MTRNNKMLVLAGSALFVGLSAMAFGQNGAADSTTEDRLLQLERQMTDLQRHASDALRAANQAQRDAQMAQQIARNAEARSR